MKELKSILERAHSYYINNVKCVLATIVKIEGSGYRRQGTRMLISKNGEYTGAISGGCVEKEVWMQSDSVFATNSAKLITYDGRYRLGCEGILFILIEPMTIRNAAFDAFNNNYEKRRPINIHSYFNLQEPQNPNAGTYFRFQDKLISLNSDSDTYDLSGLEVLDQTLKPTKSLYIFGSEHDSVSLCKIASEVGWDVTVIAHPLNEKDISFFNGAANLVHLLPEEVRSLKYDEQTACILMSHSFSRDLAYLIELSKETINYIGLLGPHKRKDQIFHHLIENNPEIPEAFLDKIYGPVGLDIGAETPAEIAISILAELQSVFSNTFVEHLRNKSGSIHEREE